MNYVILVLLIAVGVFDIYLVYRKVPTLSQRYQLLLPTWADMILLGLILSLLCFKIGPVDLTWIDARLRVWIAGMCGHVFWPNKETFGK